MGPDNFYQSHRWLRGVELANGPSPVITAWDGNRMVGALPTWPGEGNEPGLFSLPEMFPDLDAGRRPPRHPPRPVQRVTGSTGDGFSG